MGSLLLWAPTQTGLTDSLSGAYRPEMVPVNG